MSQLQTFYVTFGQKYNRQPHPHLPGWACDPNGWLEIQAPDLGAAWTLAYDVIGTVGGAVACASIYSLYADMGPHYYPRGCLGTITVDGHLVRPEHIKENA